MYMYTIKSTDRPNTLGDYVEKVQWGKTEDDTTIKERKQQYNTRPHIFNNKSNLEEGVITLEELRIVSNKCKNNKNPGADGIPLEFFKWLTDEALQPILELLNECWEADIMPGNLEVADVVTLYKTRKCRRPTQLWTNLTTTGHI